MTESSCLALVLLRQKESANFVTICNLWSYWIIESDNLDEKNLITRWSVTWCNHSGVCCYKVIPDTHINTRMCLAEQCQRMKKMDQKLKRACMYIRFLQLVNWNGLFIVWHWDLVARKMLLFPTIFCALKVVNMVCLVFAGLIVTYSLMQLQDAGCWTDAATLAAAHLKGTDYSRSLSLSLSLSLSCLQGIFPFPC